MKPVVRMTDNGPVVEEEEYEIYVQVVKEEPFERQELIYPEGTMFEMIPVTKAR